MMSDLVGIEIDAGVALLTLNRPERHNAWTMEMRSQYLDALEAARDDDAVRAIVVTGAGDAFCPGADMEMLSDASSGGERAERDERPETLPLSIPKPLIAAINGACAGIGLVHALMCDVRFAAEGAKLTTAFAKVGLIAEYGSSWLLPRIVGAADALDLLLSARVVLAEEARELGLVNRVLPREELLEGALDYARRLASDVSPTAMAVIKQQVYGHLDASFADARADSDRLMVEAFARSDLAEGVAAFTERRPPAFPPVDPAALKG
jgi:enoyl-CoA hydratase/carnithine racemase